ncbi:hypothetical protein [Kitasatospora purpeofusca]|uniref:hypothetical protein n=1 Tax=Kitasatospora purpeofusca TaxID=67352 RepID=UPI0037F58F89
MTSTIQAPSAGVALDAATPIARAMADLAHADQRTIRISYLNQSVTVHYPDGARSAERQNAIMDAFTTAFAGWGYHNRFDGGGETILSTRFTHPIDLGRIGRPGTGPHTLSSTLDGAVRTLGRRGAAERLAPHMTPEEIESVALLLLAADRAGAGEAWVRLVRGD